MTGPNQLWDWDITYLHSPERHAFFYLYSLLDHWIRKNIAWLVSNSDTIYLTAAGVPQLGDLPDTLTFLYSIPQARLTPANVTLAPVDVNTNDPITWTLTKTGTWFSAAPVSGTSPQSFQITPGSFVTNTPAVYTGVITVTVSDPPDTIGSSHRIDPTLRVIDTPLSEI